MRIWHVLGLGIIWGASAATAVLLHEPGVIVAAVVGTAGMVAAIVAEN